MNGLGWLLHWTAFAFRFRRHWFRGFGLRRLRIRRHGIMGYRFRGYGLRRHGLRSHLLCAPLTDALLWISIAQRKAR